MRKREREKYSVGECVGVDAGVGAGVGEGECVDVHSCESLRWE